MRIKVEINTRERRPVLGFVKRPAVIASAWFSGTADVVTFAPEEMLATKIRALHQRDKGRDLFDLWLGLERLALDGREIARIFDDAYRPAGFRVDDLLRRLEERIQAGSLDADVRPLLARAAPKYDATTAFARVKRDILAAVRPA